MAQLLSSAAAGPQPAMQNQQIQMHSHTRSSVYPAELLLFHPLEELYYILNSPVKINYSTATDDNPVIQVRMLPISSSSSSTSSQQSQNSSKSSSSTVTATDILYRNFNEFHPVDYELILMKYDYHHNENNELLFPSEELYKQIQLFPSKAILNGLNQLQMEELYKKFQQYENEKEFSNRLMNNNLSEFELNYAGPPLEYSIPSPASLLGQSVSLEEFYVKQINLRAEQRNGIPISEKFILRLNRDKFNRDIEETKEPPIVEEEGVKNDPTPQFSSSNSMPPPNSADSFGSTYRSIACSNARDQLLAILNHSDSTLADRIHWLGDERKFHPEPIKSIPTIKTRVEENHSAIKENRIARDLSLINLTDFDPVVLSHFRSLESEFLLDRFLAAYADRPQMSSVEELLRYSHLSDCLRFSQAEAAKFLITDDYESVNNKRKTRIRSDEKPAEKQTNQKTNQSTVLRLWQCAVKRVGIFKQIAGTMKILQKVQLNQSTPELAPSTNPHSMFLPNLNFLSQSHPITINQSKVARILDAGVRSLIAPVADELCWEELFAVNRDEFHPFSSWPIEGFSPLFSQIYLKFGLCFTLLHDELGWSAAINFMKEKSMGVAMWLAFNWFDAEKAGFTRLQMREMLERGDVSVFIGELVDRGVAVQGLMQHPGQIVYSPSGTGSVHIVISSGIYSEQLAWNSTFSSNSIRNSCEFFNKFHPVDFNSSLSNWFSMPLIFMQICHAIELGLKPRIDKSIEMLYKYIQEQQTIDGNSSASTPLQIEFFHHTRTQSACSNCRRVNIHFLINFRCIFCLGIFDEQISFNKKLESTKGANEIAAIASNDIDTNESTMKPQKKRKITIGERIFWMLMPETNKGNSN